MEGRDRLFAAGGAVVLAMLGTAMAGFAGAQTGPETAAMQALVAKAPSCIARPRVVTVTPGQSIQAAIDRAEPGTVISVEAGTYRGSLDLTGLSGTPDRPVILLSAGGVGAAVIVGAPDKPAIGAWGISDVGIYGFKVVSGTSAGDLGGFKIAGPWEKPARNVAIVGNVVTGVGTDGIKLFNGAADIKVVGNLIDGDWREEGMDNVSVERSLFAFNTVRGSARYTSITMKAGSRDITLAGNEFDSRSGVGINVGGVGTSRFNRKFPDYWKGFEASAITVTGNVVGDRPERSVAFVGANRSVLKDNFLAGAVRSRPHDQPGKLHYPSHDNRIVGNTVAKESFFQPDEGQDRGYVLAGNGTGAAKVRAGVAALPDPVRAVCPASPAGTLARTFTSSE